MLFMKSRTALNILKERMMKFSSISLMKRELEIDIPELDVMVVVVVAVLPGSVGVAPPLRLRVGAPRDPRPLRPVTMTLSRQSDRLINQLTDRRKQGRKGKERKGGEKGFLM